MRGYVTALIEPREGLRDIDGVVGSVPSFTDRDLELLRWAATHYVAPLSTIMRRTVPPNVPNGTPYEPSEDPDASGYIVESIVAGTGYERMATDMLGDDRSAGSTLVVVPSVDEATQLAAAIAAGGVDTVLAHSELPNREATASWVRAATTPGIVLVGTREVVLWPVARLSRIVVFGESRRVMKSPSSPTVGVREVAVRRARDRGVPITFIGPVPSLETLALPASVVAPEGRLWPLVEVVDRREEPPSGSPLLERTRAAVAATVRAGGSVFVLVPRRGYAAAFRCTRCGELRRCGTCAAGADDGRSCARCGTELGPCSSCGAARWQSLGAGIGSVVDDLQRVVPGEVGDASSPRSVIVGTERDLIAVGGVDLAVGVDVDGPALAPHYRAGEDALRLFVRLAHTVVRGRGRRCLVQTSDPDGVVIQSLRSGRIDEFVEAELENRRRAGFPPFGELIALEVSATFELDLDLQRELGTATVLGPASTDGRSRWLVQGSDLSEARLRLRAVVGRLRERGARVRVDVDPIDL